MFQRGAEGSAAGRREKQARTRAKNARRRRKKFGMGIRVRRRSSRADAGGARPAFVFPRLSKWILRCAADDTPVSVILNEVKDLTTRSEAREILRQASG